jgi:uncharacterized protein YuzE
MVDLDYDKEADVFYISFGEPKEAVCDEVASGVLLRRHIKTGKIVGITIIDYKAIVDDSRPNLKKFPEQKGIK